MIYTVTFNPAIDYVVYLHALHFGEVNRTKKEEVFYGGNGVNVSQVLTNLGEDNVAMGFIAGFTGEALENGLRRNGTNTDFIKIESGTTRVNVKIKARVETDINGQGPDIDDKAIDELYKKLDKLKSGDYLILAGSIPGSMPDDIYERIMERLDGRGINIVVDAAKDLLLNTLRYKPFLIKPNRDELGEMFGRRMISRSDIVEHAKRLREMGARNVLVSMGSDGAMLISETNEVHRCGAPAGKIVSTLGAGDSMVAGFLMGYIRSGSYIEAIKLGTACGSATVFLPGLATMELVEQLYKTL